MAAANVIKEFLVGLGFKIDEAGAKKFEAGIARATKVATELGAATASAAAAVETAVIKVGRQFEDLYYASQRIHSSVENIRAMDYAVTQMGGSADGARAAMEGIAEFMRSNPGGERFIASLGVETRDTNGELRDTADIIKDLGAKFRAMPYYAAKIRAGMLGIDERTLQALIRGTDEFSDRYRAMAERMGVDQQAAAKASHEFMVQVRDLKTELGLLLGKILLQMQGPGGKALQNFADTGMRVLGALGMIVLKLITWLGVLDEHTAGWSTTLLVLLAVLAPILAILDPIVVGVIAIGLAITALIDDFQAWKAGGKSLIDWGRWSGEIDHAMAAFGELGEALGELWAIFRPFAEYVGRQFIQLLGASVNFLLAVMVPAIRVLAGAIRIIVDLLTGQWSKAWQDSGALARAVIRDVVDAAKKGLDVLTAFWNAVTGRHDGQKPAPAPQQAAPAGAGAAPARAAAPAPQQGQARPIGEQIMSFFQSKGWTREQATGMAAGMFAESRFNAQSVNPTSGAYGIGQWLGSRKRELFRRYGPDPSLAQQLEFMAWELTNSEKVAGGAIRAQQSAQGALDAYVRRFMRPGDGTAGDLARGAQFLSGQFNRPVLAASGAAAQVTLSQKTDIHVHGVTDPHAAGRVAANEQGRVNGDLLRNAKGALE